MAGKAVKRKPDNLPVELTSFVGRRQELAELKHLIGSTRLLTLVGSGGAGKTRLAVRGASDMARNFPDGVRFVSLASIEDPMLVTQAVFNAVGIQDMSVRWSLSALTRYLADKRMLLVLDNCEHLLDSCAVLSRTILTSCPNLRILATSRQAFGSAGEVRMEVPPMSLPGPDTEMVPERLLNYDAVALVAERAAAVVQGFRVDAANARAILELCRRLDGIPLALELAAVRLNSLSVVQLNQALGREWAVLGDGDRAAEARQQTLEATIDWSYRLLREPGRRLWARLSVFAGRFDREAAIQVCAGPEISAEQVPELLAELIDKSIVKRDLNLDPPRYELLQTLRQFGRMRLRDFGEEVACQRRHRDWILELAQVAGAWDHRQPQAFKRASIERDNIWAALEFCLREPAEAAKGLEILRHLWGYWSLGPVRDVRRILPAMLAVTDEDNPLRGYGLAIGASLAIAQNDAPTAHDMAEEGFRLGQKLRDPDVVAWCLAYRGMVASLRQDQERATKLVESALDLARSMGSPETIAVTLSVGSFVHLWNGNWDRVVEMGEEGLARCAESGEVLRRSYFLLAVSEAHWQRGEREVAEALEAEALASKHALDDLSGIGTVVETLASMAAERGAAQRGAILLGCAQHARELLDREIIPPLRSQHERSEASTRARLGDAAFSAAFQRGHSMTTDEAVAYALGKKATEISIRPAPTGSEEMLLTRRELEIARLVAEGLNTRELASKLFISERTVEAHVANILNKLGLNSRIQLTRWVAGLSKQ